MYSLVNKEEMYAMVSRVLIVADKNPVALKASEYMAKLLPEAEYHIIYVVDTAHRGMAVTKDMEDTFREIGKEAIKDIRKALERSGAKKIRSTIREGRPHERTIWYAHKEKIDLIVLSAGIDEETKKPCLGSITNNLLARSDLPLILFTPYFREGEPRHILNINSGAIESFGATEIGLRLCGALGAEMLTLYIGAERSYEKLKEMKRKAEELNVRYSVKIVKGNPAKAALEESEKANLLIMSRGWPGVGYHFRKVFPNLSLSPQKREILRNSSIPVLLIG